MRTTWMRNIALAGLLGLGYAVSLPGCAGTRDLIDQVQPNAIKKSDLVGDYRNPKDAPEFYTRNLILEVQRTNPWMSDGLQSLTSRVRFEITEEYLIARQAFEFIENSDGHGGVRGRTNNGRIVGAWKIRSHFDMRDDYNDQTGETINKKIENTTDRPWYDREYVRVDWSKNQVLDPNSLWQFSEMSGQVKWTATPYIEDVNAREEIRSHFEEIGKGYFEVTSRWLAEPMDVQVWGMNLPYCQYQQWAGNNGYQEDTSIECNAQEVTMRTSFARVPTGEEATDYEVAEVRSSDGDVVGTLNLERSGYDVNYGIVDQTWHQFIQRYNTFKKSHYAGSVCGADRVQKEANETCATAHGANSYCDMNVKLCAMPFTEREIRPIVYYVDPRQPEFFYQGSQHSIDEWNVAIKRAIAWSREAECRRVGGDRGECHRQFFNGDIDLTKEDEPLGDDTVVLCHNPVIDGDHKACGAKGKSVRIGDIRYHMLGWWANPSFEAPLGVIVPGGDPTTGEEIGTIANVFGATVESYAARVRDQVMLMNGDITPEEYANCLACTWYGKDPASFKSDPTTKAVLNSYAEYMARVSNGERAPADIMARAKAIDIKALQEKYGMSDLAKTSGNTVDRLKAYGAAIEAGVKRGNSGFATQSTIAANVNRRAKSAMDSGLENKIMNSAWLSSLGLRTDAVGNESFKEVASPLRGMSPEAIRASSLERPVAESKVCKFPVPEKLLNLTFMAGAAAKLKARYPDGATATGEFAKAAGVEGQTIDRIVRGKIYLYEMMLPIYETTVIHEIGHLMSMEHDFTGSWDSLNYQPEYWTLRFNAQADTPACPDAGRAPGSADTCIGPRWRDPVTAQELGIVKGQEHDAIESYSSASVMDYKPDDRFGAVRLGQMDKMAANYIYGRIVETFDTEEYSLVPESIPGNVPQVGGRSFGEVWSVNGAIQNYSEWIGAVRDPASTSRANFDPHYTQMAAQFKAFDPRRCRPQTPEEAVKGIGVLGLTCAPTHKDHVRVSDMGNLDNLFGVTVFRGKELNTDEGGVISNETEPRYRWPYKVGNGQTGYFHGAVFDSGADFYEVSQNVLEQYEWAYLDYFYRGQNREANPYRAGRGIYSRIFDRIQDLQWNALSDVVRNGGGIETGSASSVNNEARRIALIDLFDALGRSLMRPQPGNYTLNKQFGQMFNAYSVPEGSNAAGVFSLGAGDSRYVDMGFDLTKQLEYNAYVTRGGSYLEKRYAAIALTDSRPRLSTIAKETYLDGRNVMYSFRSAIPEAFDRLIGGIMADDWDTVAPYVDTADAVDSNGNRPLHTVQLWNNATLAAARPATARIVDPMLGFRIKVPTVVYMMLYQPIDTNMELVNKTRIWQTGSLESVNVAADKRVTFWDPEQMVEWNAIAFGTEVIAGKTVEKGIGARMMQHANELLADAYNVTTTNVGGQVKVVYVGGRPAGAMTVKNQAALAKLRDYVAFLNQVRATMMQLGYGPCGRGEEC